MHPPHSPAAHPSQQLPHRRRIPHPQLDLDFLFHDSPQDRIVAPGFA
jgi:hypothetical protein